MGSMRMRGYKIWVWVWAMGMKEGGELGWGYGNDGMNKVEDGKENGYDEVWVILDDGGCVCMDPVYVDGRIQSEKRWRLWDSCGDGHGTGMVGSWVYETPCWRVENGSGL